MKGPILDQAHGPSYGDFRAFIDSSVAKPKTPALTRSWLRESDYLSLTNLPLFGLVR